MRAMSFKLTTAQILAGTKTVTRRTGWAFLQPGTRLWAVEQAMGLKKGQQVRRLAMIEVVDVRREPLKAILDQGQVEVDREGFPHLDPQGFVDMLLVHYGKAITPDTAVTRVAFSYLEAIPMSLWSNGEDAHGCDLCGWEDSLRAYHPVDQCPAGWLDRTLRAAGKLVQAAEAWRPV